MKDTPIVYAKDAPLDWLDEVGVAKVAQGHKYESKRRYLDLITAFDIETSIYYDDQEEPRPHGYMYIWQWQLGDQYTVIGRTWEEFKEFYDRLAQHLSEERYLMVFVHNLAYEFCWLAGVLDMDQAEIFATELRKPLYFRLNNMEFRCSMRLSNCGLAKWTQSMGVDHQKLSGEEFDYTETRYPWTKLTDRQIQYCVHDVIGLVECVQETMRRHQDTLYTLPYTSTGFIRRMVKEALNPYRWEIAKQQPTLEVYEALRMAYRGGDTHANRHELGSILCDVYSYDRSSSYPDVMMHCRFPVSPWRKSVRTDLEWCARLTEQGRCWLAKVHFEGLRIKTWNTAPYISLSKTWGAGLATPEGYRLDNGRVLCADKLDIWVTDIDMRIILDEYNVGSIEVKELYSARYGYLPKPIREVIKKLYKDKTELKNVPGKEEDYQMAKELLNSVYGMMVQRTISDPIVFQGGKWDTAPYDKQELYDKRLKKTFLNYSWGVYTCAWARFRLHQGISCIPDTCGEHSGWLDFVYADTDSVKATADLDLESFNKKRIADALKSGAYATDPQGVTHYMGVFEKETTYDKFVTLGAKRYAYEINGKLGMTAAGISKQYGAKELEKLGGLRAFKDGVVFNEAGHVSAYYNDNDDFWVIADGRKLHITRNVALVEKPYKLKLSQDMRDLIENFEEMIDILEETQYNILAGDA